MGIGLVVYVVIVIIFLSLLFSGILVCNDFFTVGPAVDESFLCQPAIFSVAIPHLSLYGTPIIYLGLGALLGWLYGKIRNRNKII